MHLPSAFFLSRPRNARLIGVFLYLQNLRILSEYGCDLLPLLFFFYPLIFASKHAKGLFRNGEKLSVWEVDEVGASSLFILLASQSYLHQINFDII